MKSLDLIPCLPELQIKQCESCHDVIQLIWQIQKQPEQPVKMWLTKNRIQGNIYFLVLRRWHIESPQLTWVNHKFHNLGYGYNHNTLTWLASCLILFPFFFVSPIRPSLDLDEMKYGIKLKSCYKMRDKIEQKRIKKVSNMCYMRTNMWGFPQRDLVNLKGSKATRTTSKNMGWL